MSVECLFKLYSIDACRFLCEITAAAQIDSYANVHVRLRVCIERGIHVSTYVCKVSQYSAFVDNRHRFDHEAFEYWLIIFLSRISKQ